MKAYLQAFDMIDVWKLADYLTMPELQNFIVTKLYMPSNRGAVGYTRSSSSFSPVTKTNLIEIP